MKPLGSFFWCSLPSEMKSVEQVRRAWRTHGLDVRFLPRSRKPADVAAEACTIVDRATTGPSFLQVENSSERLVYQVSGPASDTEMIFEKATGEFVCLDEKLLRQVRGVYERNSTRFPPHKQRQALLAYLHAAGAENLFGSIYFMPAMDRATAFVVLDGAQAMCNTLYGDEHEFHCVPASESDASQIAYVRRSIDRLLTAELGELTAEIREMLDKEPHRKWRSDRIAALERRERELRERRERFAQLLDGEIENAAKAAMLTRAVLGELVNSLEEPVIS